MRAENRRASGNRRRIERERLAQLAFGLRVSAEREEGDTQIVVRCGVIGMKLDRLFEALDRFEEFPGTGGVAGPHELFPRLRRHRVQQFLVWETR